MGWFNHQLVKVYPILPTEPWDDLWLWCHRLPGSRGYFLEDVGATGSRKDRDCFFRNFGDGQG